MSSKIVKAILCPVCGCCCDDIEVTIKNNEIIDVKNACAIGEAKFIGYSKHRCSAPLIRKNGEMVEVSLDEAIRKSAEILINASYPLLYGWSSTSCEAIRKGIELAEEVGGVIDNTSSVCHGPSILGIQEVGISSSTLGQIRHRADLIIYWGSNPMSAHPRHIERYTAFSEGRFQKSSWKHYFSQLSAVLTKKRLKRLKELFFSQYMNDRTLEYEHKIPSTLFREGRKIMVIDVRKTHSADLADYFLKIRANEDYELLQALRMLIRDEEVEKEEVSGVPINILEEIAEIMINCNFGIIFFGVGLTMSEGKLRNIDAALSLVRDLNRRTKFLIMPLRGHFNVTGANTVFTWQTGYPFAVDFSQGYPRYNPGETSAVDILTRGDMDASLIVASDPVSNFPRMAVENLIEKPLIVIDPDVTPTSLMADVVFPAAYVGIEAEGTAYRMDHVPLPLKKIINAPEGCLSDLEILERILQEIRKIRRENTI